MLELMVLLFALLTGVIDGAQAGTTVNCGGTFTLSDNSEWILDGCTNTTMFTYPVGSSSLTNVSLFVRHSIVQAVNLPDSLSDVRITLVDVTFVGTPGGSSPRLVGGVNVFSSRSIQWNEVLINVTHPIMSTNLAVVSINCFASGNSAYMSNSVILISGHTMAFGFDPIPSLPSFPLTSTLMLLGDVIITNVTLRVWNIKVSDSASASPYMNMTSSVVRVTSVTIYASKIEVHDVQLTCAIPCAFQSDMGVLFHTSTIRVSNVTLLPWTGVCFALPPSAPTTQQVNYVDTWFSGIVRLWNATDGTSLTVRNVSVWYQGSFSPVVAVYLYNGAVMDVSDVTVGLWGTWGDMNRSSIVYVSVADHSSISIRRIAAQVRGIDPTGSTVWPLTWITFPQYLKSNSPSVARCGTASSAYVLYSDIMQSSNVTMDSVSATVYGSDGFLIFYSSMGLKGLRLTIYNLTFIADVLYIAGVVHFRTLQNSAVNLTAIRMTAMSDGNITMFGPTWCTMYDSSLVIQSVTYDVRGFGFWPSATLYYMVFLTQFRNSSLVIDDVQDLYFSPVGTSISQGILQTTSQTFQSNITLRNVHGGVGNFTRCKQIALVSTMEMNRSTVIVDNVSITYFSSDSVGLSVVSATTNEGAVLNVTNVHLVAFMSVSVPTLIPSVSIVTMKPASFGEITMVNCSARVSSPIGFSGIMTASSCRSCVIHATNVSFWASLGGGTTSILSAGVMDNATIVLTDSTMFTVVGTMLAAVGVSMCIDSHVELRGIFLDGVAQLNIAAFAVAGVMTGSVVIIDRLTTSPTSQGSHGGVVTQQAFSAAMLEKYSPGMGLAPGYLVKVVKNSSFQLTNIVWTVTCVPLLVTGNCVIVGLYGSQVGNTISLFNVTGSIATLSSPMAPYLPDSGLAGVILISATPLTSLGDLQNPTSDADATIFGNIVNVSDVAISFVSLTLTKKFTVLMIDCIGGDLSGSVPLRQNKSETMSVTLFRVRVTVPQNATLVQVGMRRRVTIHFSVRECDVVYSSTMISLVTSSDFKGLQFCSLFPQEARNASVAVSFVTLAWNWTASLHNLICQGTCSSVIVVDNVGGWGGFPCTWFNSTLSFAYWNVDFVNPVTVGSGGAIALIGCGLRFTQTTMTDHSVIELTAPSSLFRGSFDRFVFGDVFSLRNGSTILLCDDGNGEFGRVPLGAFSWLNNVAAVDLVNMSLCDSYSCMTTEEPSVIIVRSIQVQATSPSSVSTLVISSGSVLLSLATSSESSTSTTHTFFLTINMSMCSLLMTNREPNPSLAAVVRFAGSSGVEICVESCEMDWRLGNQLSLQTLLLVAPPFWLSGERSAFPGTSLLFRNNIWSPLGTSKNSFTTVVRPQVVNTPWWVAARLSAQSPRVVCNRVNHEFQLHRSDPSSVLQNISKECDSYTREMTASASCFDVGRVNVTPTVLSLYEAYQQSIVLTVSQLENDTMFSVPVHDADALRLVTLSWGTVKSVQGVDCRASGSSAQSCKTIDITVSARSANTIVVVTQTYDSKLRINGEVFSCPMAGYSTFDISFAGVVPPVPPAASESASITSAVVAVMGGAFAMPTVGIALARTSLIFDLAQCAYSDSDMLARYDSPFRWSFGNVDGAYIRGAVVGNCCLVWFMTIAALLVSLVFHVRSRIVEGDGFIACFQLATLQQLAAKTHCPSNMVIPGSWILQATIASSVALLWSRWDGASDVCVGLLGLIAPIGLLIKYYQCILVRLPKSCIAAEAAVPWTTPPTLASALDWYTADNTRWKQMHQAEDPLFKKKYFEIFTQYRGRYYWFLIVETGCCLIFGVLQGVRPKDQTMCDRLSWAVFALSVLMFVTCVKCFPYSTRFDESILQINNGFTLVASALLLVPDNAQGTFATAADSVVITQVYVSALLTMLWFVHKVSPSRFLLYFRRDGQENTAPATRKSSRAFKKAQIQVGTAAADVELPKNRHDVKRNLTMLVQAICADVHKQQKTTRHDCGSETMLPSSFGDSKC